MPETPVLLITVAAGSGSRFGSDLPKQFCRLVDRPVVMHAIDRLREASSGARDMIVVSDPMRPLWNELCGSYGFRSPEVVSGGASRWESVRNAVFSASAMPDDTIVAIHDGARPLVDVAVVSAAIEAVASGRTDGAVPAVAVTDSLRQIDDANPGGVAVDRSVYRAVQTPQVFRLGVLRRAYGRPFRPEFTDDASVVEADGGTVALTPGSPVNIKITHPLDLVVAEAMLREQR